jgi:hypothetical protein
MRALGPFRPDRWSVPAASAAACVFAHALCSGSAVLAGDLVSIGYHRFRGSDLAVPHRSIDAGDGHTVAVGLDGALRAWGLNVSGESAPSAFGIPVRSASAGTYFTVALLDDGSLRCWGDNRFGQCTVPTGLAPSVAVSAGSGHAMALGADGRVRC